MESYNLALDPNAAGETVKAHLIRLQNLFGRVTEVHVSALHDHEEAKLFLDEVSEKVDMYILNKYPISKNIKKQKLNICVDVGDEKDITLLIARRRFIDTKCELASAKAALSQLKSAIDTARSALAWARQELADS